MAATNFGEICGQLERHRTARHTSRKPTGHPVRLIDMTLMDDRTGFGIDPHYDNGDDRRHKTLKGLLISVVSVALLVILLALIVGGGSSSKQSSPAKAKASGPVVSNTFGSESSGGGAVAAPVPATGDMTVTVTPRLRRGSTMAVSRRPV